MLSFLVMSLFHRDPLLKDLEKAEKELNILLSSAINSNLWASKNKGFAKLFVDYFHEGQKKGLDNTREKLFTGLDHYFTTSVIFIDAGHLEYFIKCYGIGCGILFDNLERVALHGNLSKRESELFFKYIENYFEHLNNSLKGDIKTTHKNVSWTLFVDRLEDMVSHHKDINNETKDFFKKLKKLFEKHVP
jgi:hypothetical protein